MSHREWLQVDARTAIEAAVDADRTYRLAAWHDGECIVEFRSEQGRHRKRIQARTTGYEFRSIEQLRYDFEREIEHLVDRR